MTLNPGDLQSKRTDAELNSIQHALRENDDWCSDLVQHSQDLLCIHDLEGRLLAVNPVPAKLLGYSVDEILQIPMREMIAPEFRAAFDAYMQEIANRGESRGLMAVQTRFGEIRIWEYHNTLRTEGVTKPIVRGIAHDVTDRVRAERLLREANASLNRAQTVAHIGSWRYDMLSDALLVSDETSRVLGLSTGATARPESVMKRIHPADRSRVNFGWEQAVRSGHGELEALVSIRGEDRCLYAVADVQFDKDRRPVAVVGTVQDITERKRAEGNRLLLASIIQTAADAIFSKTLDGVVTSWNPAAERMYGYQAEEMIGKPITLLIPPDRRHEYQTMMAKARDGHPTTNLDTVRIRKDGTPLHVSVTASPIRAQNGTITGISVMHRDITERKQAEVELRTVTEELRLAKEKLAEEKLYLEQEIDCELGFEDIIGKSKALRAVIEQVGKVAASDATVLLLGETGTGKELLARAIHRRSPRKAGNFIKMNCASIPAGLLESELFGYEKGAFTSAAGRKLGRIELADRGTLFLDEIGELPLHLQPKLLRVLQDQEFERLGSTQTLKVNFRLIAATNRDLPAEVGVHNFRSDLYYRLSVFPIRVPPLRDRREDIPLLTEYFVAKCARRMNKSISSISAATIKALSGWDWPGNIRELENFVERSVILTRGSSLEAPLHELRVG